MVAAAVIGAGVVGAVGSTIAAGKQSSGQQQAAQTQEDMFNQITANEKPYMGAGNTAETDLQGLLGETGTPGTTVGGTGLQQGYLTSTFDPNNLNNNPAYQFALQQGGQATRNADTPGMGALSGAALKDLTNFDVGTANTYENQYFNQDQTQKNSIYSRLAGIASLGQNAASNVGNNGAQLGTGVAQAEAASAGSTAGGIVGATNSLTGAANNYAGLQYLQAGSVGGDYGTKSVAGAYDPTSPNYIQPGTPGFTGPMNSAEGGPVTFEEAKRRGLLKGYAMGGAVYDNPYSMEGMIGGAAYPEWGAPQQMTNLPAMARPTMSTMMPTASPWESSNQPSYVGGATLNNIANGMTPGVQPARPIMTGGFGGASPRAMMAMGGPVDGPGGPKDDRIPAMLSDGEHVLTAHTVNAIGGGNNDVGQAKLMRLQDMCKRRAM